MRIDAASMNASLWNLGKTRQEVELAAQTLKSNIGAHFSNIVGFSDAGVIHGRAIKNDPGSAQNLLLKHAEQVGWATQLLNDELQAVQEQDATNASGLDLADVGGRVGGASVALANQPESRQTPLSYVPPFVMTGASLQQLSSDFAATRIGDIAQVAADWNQLAGDIQSSSDGLKRIAAALETEQDSDFTYMAAQKIREFAMDGQQFAVNAADMGLRSSGITMNYPPYLYALMVDNSTMVAMTHPAAQKAFEAVTLFKWQAKLQSMVSQSLPNQQSLMDAPSGHGGGDSMDIGLEAIAGLGTRYTTEDVEWPREIQQALESGELGPGSFEVVNGELAAVDGVDPSLVEKIQSAVNERREELYGGGRLQEYLANGIQTMENSTTQSAGLSTSYGVAQGNTLGMGSGQVSNGHPGISGLGNGSGVTGPLGLAAGSGVGSAGTGAGAVGRAPAASRVGGIGGRGIGGIGGGPGSAFGQGSAGDSASRALAGGSDGAGRSGGIHGAAAQGTGTQNGSNGRGVGPLMAPGAAGRGQDNKKRGMVKSVTSRVEMDKNRRDLLGEPPAAVPGPIGDWARH